MKAVVMAGGQGTRLRPLTANVPKPMVPIGNKPCALHILELLKRHGVSHVIMTVAFMSEVIRNYFGDGSSLGMTIEYAVEDSPLGTAGSVKNAETALDDTFLIISGDALTDFDLTKIVSFHRERDALVTIALKSVDNPLEFGIVIVDEDGRVERFLEKPGWGQVFSDTINTGIYVMEPEILDYIPVGRPYDFSHELFPKLFQMRKPLYGCVQEAYWQDIGSLEQYLQANRDVLDGKVKVELPGVRLRGNIWMGEGVALDSLDNVKGPALIGNYVRVEQGAELGPHAILGNNVVVKAGASVVNSVVGDNCYIGIGARLEGAILGSSVDVRRMAVIEEGAVVGDRASIGESSIIGNRVKIYPFKRVDPGSSVKSSLLWERKGTQSLFGKVGVRGVVNIDITAETALRLAMAYGTVLSKDSRVTVSRDAHPASCMLKRALVAGLTSTGVSVRDLEVAPVPINRFDIQTGAAVGGIHVRLCSSDPETAEILFSESPGVPINPQRERSIESIYNREEFRRAFPAEIGTVSYPVRVLNSYVQACLDGWNAELVRRRGIRAAVCAGEHLLSFPVSALIEALGIKALIMSPREHEEGADTAGQTNRLARLVQAMEADLGVLLDETGERLHVVDDLGRPLPGDVLLRLLVARACEELGPGVVAVPVNVSERVDQVVEARGSRVVRTKVAGAGLMGQAAQPDTILAGDSEGGFIFPSFSPSFDALFAFGKLLELVAVAGQTLAELADEMPAAFLVHHIVGCPWHLKGLVMRLMVEEHKDAPNVSLVDGIRISFGPLRWVQIIPDADDPSFHIYAEADTPELAGQLALNERSRLEGYVLKHITND